jgi:glycosyltransferase involved in cell wall biosynthesis
VTKRRYDVTIYAPFAGHLYATQTDRASGGAETQMRELARALTGQGLRVCHVVFDYGDIPASSEGIDLVTQPPDEFTRNLVPYSRSIMRALARADAAVYVQRTAGFETGVVGAFARARRRRFVFSASSTTDLESRPPLPTAFSSLAFRLGLRAADALVAQTDDQIRSAQDQLRRTPELIRSLCDVVPDAGTKREAFLWIGGLIDYKDPLAYVALAERVPEAQFWMVGTDRGEDWRGLSDQVHAAAARLPNFTMLPPRSRRDLLELYARAVAVVNTSLFEGFPNTFMEGWARGAPALSLRVDPDGTIARHGIGRVAGGSIDELASAARELWNSRDGSDQLGNAARSYIASTHSPGVVGRQWVELIESLRANRRRGFRAAMNTVSTSNSSTGSSR